MILGVAWLATLGDVKVNWKMLTMNFSINGQQVQIRVDPKLSRTLVTPKALKMETEIEVVSLIWGRESADQPNAYQIESDKKTMGLTGKQTTQLKDVLKKCVGVFEETKQLTPNREIDHKIPIRAGIDPINVRPYRYPHLLKTEIEK